MLRISYLLTVAALHATASSAINVSLLLSPPPGSHSLARTLVSFSLEQDRWPDWSGVHSRNEFTNRALENYAELTGELPKIRVGADSEDHTFWSPTVTINEDEFPPANTITPYPEATQITVGDEYYELSRFLPRGTHMTWGVNLGADNVTNAVNMAKAIVGAFRTGAVKASGVIMDLIEVGNEADLYQFTGLRSNNSDWTVEDYVSDWIDVAGPVAEAAGIRGRDGPVSIQGAAFESQLFTPREIFDLGILDSEPGQRSPKSPSTTKAAVRGNLTLFEDDIAATHARGLTYVLGETNSIACHGAPGVSNTAGAALWTIDYTLQAATLGVKELFFHEGIGYKYNFVRLSPFSVISMLTSSCVVPTVTLNRSTIDGSPLDPPVAHISSLDGVRQIVELPVDDSNVAGYAAYEHGRLARAVFVNLHAWLASSTGERPAVHIDFDFAFAAESSGARRSTQSEVNAFWSRKAAARRLVIEHADDTAGLKWVGQSYETGDVRPTGRLVLERVVLSEGIDLRSSEAVLVEF
ncbi:glycoside hydrolase family 79 protein [Cerioporus squamosus]|nr:glycoside hydrolase family 79 protein [Cerioporus squamosus]